MTKNIYQQRLIDHYHQSPFKKIPDTPDFTSQVHHPSCGDKVRIAGTVTDGTITAIGFEGAGCILSQAAASLLCEWALNKTVSEVQAMTPEGMQQLVAIPVGPVRFKCVALSLDALLEGIKTMQKGSAC